MKEERLGKKISPDPILLFLSIGAGCEVDAELLGIGAASATRANKSKIKEWGSGKFFSPTFL